MIRVLFAIEGFLWSINSISGSVRTGIRKRDIDSCEVRQNLFGQWVVLRRWGRVSALQGQSREEVCDHYEQGLEIFDVVSKRRAKRGYLVW
jgi:hypothetical protein